jgi:2'-5' RNA ligase
MSNLVVVAIPEEMDRVWKLSSEQVPHLTLLFLGEADNNPRVNDIVQFVEHAVTLSEHGPFYLDIDHRGTLGPDEADVLFFSKRSWNLKWIKQFRGQLLQNENVRSAYDSAQQYDEWEPHLTMGYPTSPAKEMGENDHPLYSVCFDRIAVWDADYAGPEFRLEWPERELDGPLAVAYSDTQKAALTHCIENGIDPIEHHGVKVKIKTDARGGKIDEGADVNAVHGDIVSIAERGKAFIEHGSVLNNPTIQAQIKAKLQNILDDVTTDADGNVNLFGDPVLQAKIRSVLQDFYQDPNVDNAVVYSALGETIQHFGIKGMRWGFRRKEPPTAVAPKATSKVPHGDRRKTKIDTEGGQNHDAHPDALKVAESSAKLRKSGTKALSNHELAALAERARLEKAAIEADRHGASKWVRKFLGNQGNQAANQIVRTEVDSRIRSARAK